MKDEAEFPSLYCRGPEHDKTFTAAKRKQSKAWEELNESIPVLGEDFGESERWLGALLRYEVAFERSLWGWMERVTKRRTRTALSPTLSTWSCFAKVESTY